MVIGGGSVKDGMCDHVIRWICVVLLLTIGTQSFGRWTSAAAAVDGSETVAIDDRPGVRLKFAAFNIELFGRQKMLNTAVVDCLKKLLSKYDVVFIQEIYDQTNASIVALLAAVNSVGAGSWSMVLSGRLGRTSSKEQYAFFYKTNTVSVVDEYHWPDTLDVFERPPFIIRIKVAATNTEFGFIGVHVKPSDAVNEISNLTEVYDSMAARWAIQDFVIGGDINAVTKYVKNSDWPRIRLRNDARFLWVIDDNIGTTVFAGSQANDRFVLAGTKMRSFYVNGSGRAYKYESDLGLNATNITARDVSDHYPIELQLVINEAACNVRLHGNFWLFEAVILAAVLISELDHRLK